LLRHTEQVRSGGAEDAAPADAKAPRTPKAISGISRRTFLNVRNQEGSEEILRNCDETWRGTIDHRLTGLADRLCPQSGKESVTFALRF